MPTDPKVVVLTISDLPKAKVGILKHSDFSDRKCRNSETPCRNSETPCRNSETACRNTSDNFFEKPKVFCIIILQRVQLCFRIAISCIMRNHAGRSDNFDRMWSDVPIVRQFGSDVIRCSDRPIVRHNEFGKSFQNRGFESSRFEARFKPSLGHIIYIYLFTWECTRYLSI